MALFHTTVVDNQIKALPTVDTASGAIATFDTDLTENLVEVKCQIVATQSGSGAPSPSNPRPIGVYDSLTLYHNDINMWDEEWERGAYDSNGEKTVNLSFIRSITKIAVSPNTTYYFKTPTNEGRICYYEIDGTFISRSNGFGNNTFTTPNHCRYITFFTREMGDYGYNISVNYPSTDTQYHAFNGAYIPFSQTVANGVLDITTGKLRVTDKVVDMGSLSWNPFTFGSNSGFRAILSDGEAIGGGGGIGNAVCSVFPIVNNSAVGASGADMVMAVGAYWTPGCNAYVVDSDYTTASDFKTGMSGNQLVYRLATPQVIQLNANQVTALLNENNIWCDTGDTEVKYLLSVGKKIS